MAINVADNFSYKGSKPLDARIKANTVSALVSTPAADLYDGCFAYVTETKKYYSYDSTNTSDPTLGKWREFQQGGGGGGSLPAGGTTGQSLVKHSDSDNDAEWFDVNKEISFDDFNELTQEEKDNGTSYYIPDATVVSNFTVMGNRFDKANIYTDTERMIGSWMGKPLYQKTINFGHNYDNNNRITKTLTEIGISNLDKFVYMEGMALASGGAAMPVPLAQSSNEIIYLYYATSITSIIIVCTTASWKDRDVYITLQYTKTTDTTVNIGTGNDYSTDEQIIGTWIDGKPIYQKTISGTIPTPSADFGSLVNQYIDVSALNIDTFLGSFNVAKSSTLSIAFDGEWSTRKSDGTVGILASFHDPVNTRITVINNRLAYGSLTINITIKYTKTTD